MNDREKLAELTSELTKIIREIGIRKSNNEDTGEIISLFKYRDRMVNELIQAVNMEIQADYDKNLSEESNPSVKNDRLDDKLRWELLPLEDIEDVVKVYTAGAKKYGANKWQDLPDGIQRYKAALLRHLVEFEKGNEIDEETGCRHLAQCAWNAIAMLHISKQKQQ